ncbi:putative zinc-type alcohol dehydrogenase-like protein YjmD [Botrimarina colliarenosi]|uniref:Putative zinc-type alcohol dehydrogenase-like protein YjmD n=1 Tax=Botrimarina colliarenosi TaxID=2528001 RepID=A0A5C6AE70_9BACT|nr:zinc-binding alcohol dehydrogenase family protein [Botrimarina colliarenosi]TWT97720.1 putative zinc-type alcohol dehydrogenase-like protein YjmD [Botrimarina colliarenosi]
MKALQITEPGQVRLTGVPEITPASGEVLLQIRTVGYCGTDLSTFRGRNPLVTYPRIPGHEVAAVVAALGEGVDGWAIGDEVLVFPYTECGVCSSCLAGRPNCCKHNQTLGVQREGLLTEYAAVPAGKLLRGDGLSSRELALVEPLTVGAHAVARGQVAAGETVAVFGCGAIGLGAVAAAAFAGARVIAIDIDDRKLAIARACGAAECVNSQNTDVANALAELTEGHGPAVVIEAVGLPATFRAAVDLVAFAGRVVYIGYASQPVEYETKWFVMKEIDIRGSRNALKADFERVIAMLQQGRVPTDQIVTQEVSLEEAPDALRQWSDRPGDVTKVHVRLSGGRDAAI